MSQVNVRTFVAMGARIPTMRRKSHLLIRVMEYSGRSREEISGLVVMRGCEFESQQGILEG